MSTIPGKAEKLIGDVEKGIKINLDSLRQAIFNSDMWAKTANGKAEETRLQMALQMLGFYFKVLHVFSALKKHIAVLSYAPTYELRLSGAVGDLHHKRGELDVQMQFPLTLEINRDSNPSALAEQLTIEVVNKLFNGLSPQTDRLLTLGKGTPFDARIRAYRTTLGFQISSDLDLDAVHNCGLDSVLLREYLAWCDMMEHIEYPPNADNTIGISFDNFVLVEKPVTQPDPDQSDDDTPYADPTLVLGGGNIM